jgi:hypothetical protein
MKSLKFVTAGVSAILAIGCGGTSGVSNGFPANPNTNGGNPVGPGVNGGSAMVTLTTGQTFTYAVTGTVTKDYLDSSNNKKTISGPVTNATLVRELSADPDGIPGHFQVVDTLTYTIQGNPQSVEVSTWYLAQNPDNSLSILGETKFNFATLTDSNIPLVPGTFSTSANFSGNADLVFQALPVGWDIPAPAGTFGPDYTGSVSPGTGTIESAVTNLNQETVPASTGAAYTAWKTQYTQSEVWNINGVWILYDGLTLAPGTILQSNVNKTLTEDWVPSMGASVRSYLTLTESDVPITAFNFTPATYNVPPAITYTFGPTLNKKEDLELVLTSFH